MGRLSDSFREQALLLQKAQARSKDRSLRQLLQIEDFADVSDSSRRLSVGSEVDRLWVSLTNQRPGLVVRIMNGALQGVSPCSILLKIHLQTKTPPPTNSPVQKRFHEAAERALDHYLKPNALTLRFHKPSTMFQITPDQDNESLLAHACESLASASTMTSDIAAHVDAPQRHTILAIQQIIMLAELAVNRVLDNVDVTRSASHN